MGLLAGMIDEENYRTQAVIPPDSGIGVDEGALMKDYKEIMNGDTRFPGLVQ